MACTYTVHRTARLAPTAGFVVLCTLASGSRRNIGEWHVLALVEAVEAEDAGAGATGPGWLPGPLYEEDSAITFA